MYRQHRTVAGCSRQLPHRLERLTQLGKVVVSREYDLPNIPANEWESMEVGGFPTALNVGEDCCTTRKDT